MSIVGENIKRIRTAQNISQNKLAKKAGIAQATLSAIERQTKNPTIDTIELLASALNCTVAELMGETDQNEIEQGTITDPLLQSIITDYNQISPDNRRKFREYLDLLLNQRS